MATAKQRAAARRNIKKAQAALRRRFGRSRRHSGGSSSGGHPAPGFAATYQSAKTGLQILSPATNAGLQALEGSMLPERIPESLANVAKNPGYRSAYAKGVGVSILQAYADAKLRHAAAVARKSVTAMAPEAYALGTAIADNDLDPVDTHADFIETTSGFNPRRLTFTTRGKLRTYLTLKYGGAGVRKVAAAFPMVGRPIKKALNTLGLTL